MVYSLPKDRYVIASPVDYEQLTVEIFIDDRFVAIINRELGDDNLQIEFLVKHEETHGIPLALFLSLVEKAKAALLEHARV